MKITFVTSHLTGIVGGSKFLMEFANSFCERGHDITVIAQKIYKNNYQFQNKISIIEVKGPLPSNPLHWLFFKILKRKFLKEIYNLDCDLIISLSFPANYFCSIEKENDNIKHIYYCLEPYRFFHDKKFYSNCPFLLRNITRILRFFFKKLDIKGALAADEIVSISNFTKERVKKTYNRESYLHHIGIEINENSIKYNNFNLRYSLSLKERTPIIFTLGLTHYLKGAKELILIFHKILKEIPEATLLIGGKIIKENEKIIRKLIKRLKIPEKNIIFYGFIERELIDKIYEQTTLTFYTAIDEAYGYIPIESMKNGTPILAFEGGPSDTIRDGETGYLIKNNNIDDFTQKAIKLIKDENLYKIFSKNAKIHVKNNFNFEKSISELESLFEKFISRNK